MSNIVVLAEDILSDERWGPFRKRLVKAFKEPSLNDIYEAEQTAWCINRDLRENEARYPEGMTDPMDIAFYLMDSTLSSLGY